MKKSYLKIFSLVFLGSSLFSCSGWGKGGDSVAQSSAAGKRTEAETLVGPAEPPNPSPAAPETTVADGTSTGADPVTETAADSAGTDGEADSTLQTAADGTQTAVASGSETVADKAGDGQETGATESSPVADSGKSKVGSDETPIQTAATDPSLVEPPAEPKTLNEILADFPREAAAPSLNEVMAGLRRQTEQTNKRDERNRVFMHIDKPLYPPLVTAELIEPTIADEGAAQAEEAAPSGPSAETVVAGDAAANGTGTDAGTDKGASERPVRVTALDLPLKKPILPYVDVPISPPLPVEPNVVEGSIDNSSAGAAGTDGAGETEAPVQIAAVDPSLAEPPVVSPDLSPAGHPETRHFYQHPPEDPSPAANPPASPYVDVPVLPSEPVAEAPFSVSLIGEENVIWQDPRVCDFKDQYLRDGLIVAGSNIVALGESMDYEPFSPGRIVLAHQKNADFWEKLYPADFSGFSHKMLPYRGFSVETGRDRAKQRQAEAFLKNTPVYNDPAAEESSQSVTGSLLYNYGGDYDDWCPPKKSWFNQPDCHLAVIMRGQIKKGDHGGFLRSGHLTAEIYFNGKLLDFSACDAEEGLKTVAALPAGTEAAVTEVAEAEVAGTTGHFGFINLETEVVEAEVAGTTPAVISGGWDSSSLSCDLDGVSYPEETIYGDFLCRGGEWIQNQ